jgi:hypothetical protein
MTIRCPQRFRWRKKPTEPWKWGCCYPHVHDPDRWYFDAGRGFGSFASDPTETIRQVLGEGVTVQWLDNDFGFAPQEAVCCGKTFLSALALREHLKTCPG